MVRLISMGIECISSMVFLIPVIIILQYILFKQHGFYQFVMILITAIYFMAMYSVTGLPTAYTLRFDFSLNLIPLIDIMNSPAEYIKNTVLNILLFMPLGFLLPVIWSEYRNAKKMVLTGLALSVIIEILQIFTFRFTDIDDLITNTLGTALGYVIAKMISFKLPLKISEKEKTVSMKYEPVIIWGTVFLIGFFLKPLVSNAIWDAVLYSSWWEGIK
ncbi:MAG: VanZ family protein [Lachnospiraceae bacterium]|nr:VanZ family protein [Lachnospiraceae bacterium]